jgi:hypothetical protein
LRDEGRDGGGDRAAGGKREAQQGKDQEGKKRVRSLKAGMKANSTSYPHNFRKSLVFIGKGRLIKHVAMSGTLKKSAASTAANKLFSVMAGWGIWSSSSFYYDRIIYPSLMLKFGDFWGGIVAAVGAILICMGFLLHYEFSKLTWISSTEEILGTIASNLERIEKRSAFLRAIFIVPRLLLQLTLSYVEKRSVFGFILLSTQSDPFLTTSFFRQGRGDGLKMKDWGRFFVSAIIANVYWIAYTAIILVPIRIAWRFIQILI